MNPDIRWKQRFQNFRRAFSLLREPFEEKELSQFSRLEMEGIVNRFEHAFELGWKVFYDYLKYIGIFVKHASPRKVIKECAAVGIFDEAGINGDTYLEMMFSRNSLSHSYNFDRSYEIFNKIKNAYLNELEKEYMYFMQKELSADD